MTDYGNTGQPYAMSKRTDVQIDKGRNGVRVTLECGHSYLTMPWYNQSVETLAEICRGHIGKRQRCTDCEVK